jgi:hypothetical protein
MRHPRPVLKFCRPQVAIMQANPHMKFIRGMMPARLSFLAPVSRKVESAQQSVRLESPRSAPIVSTKKSLSCIPMENTIGIILPTA